MVRDITGIKFHHLTAIRRAKEVFSVKGNYWEFECDCENKTHKFIRKSDVVYGRIKSCGCKMRTEVRHKHDGTHTRLYSVYKDMLRRCYNPNSRSYKNYGARGIEVCPEWRGDSGFINFRKWALDNGFDESPRTWKCTIDRIDVDGNYEPSNCRWVDMGVQQNNKRTNNNLEAFGETHTNTEWARMFSISPSSLYFAVCKRGESPEEAILGCFRRRKNANEPQDKAKAILLKFS